MRKFTRMRLDRELRSDADGMPVFRSCFQHEVMMTFFDDSGAQAFRRWWETEGVDGFSSFYEKYMTERGVTDLDLFF